MKQMWQTIEVKRIKETEEVTFLEVATKLSKDDILRYSTAKGLHAEIRFDDDRNITSQQRKKLYATFRDIADYTGDIPEYTKELLKFNFCSESGQEYFSLSNCSLEVARELINYVIEFVIMNDIPLSEMAIERTDDIGKFLFYSLKHEKCCCCGIKGITYTLDKEKNKMCLCDTHYNMAKTKGLEEFSKAYKVYGIKYVG